MRRRGKVAGSLILASFGIVACGSSGSGAVATGKKDPESLRREAVGVWLYGEHGCTCMGNEGDMPECSAPDCKESDVLALGDDGRALRFTTNRTSSRFSAFGGAVTSGTWSINPQGKFVWSFNKASPFDIETKENALVLDTGFKNMYVRAPSGFADAVWKSSATQQWRTVPYQQ